MMDPMTPFVRVADIEVDPAQRDTFVAAVKDEMDESVRVEPGVLALYAVAEKDAPSRFRFFEIYADESAYDAHVASAHFMRYRTTTESMIRSRVLVQTVPIQLSTKAAWWVAGLDRLDVDTSTEGIPGDQP
jgi:quinol monooxygenase YgiN